MKTKKEAEEISGVTLSHFTKGKGQKTLSNTDLSQKSICDHWCVFFALWEHQMGGLYYTRKSLACFHTWNNTKAIIIDCLVMLHLSVIDKIYPSHIQNELYDF